MADDKRPAGHSRPAPAIGLDPIPAKVLHKREFLARVAADVRAPRTEIREVVEATLSQLGRAISAGETLALPPFGKARVSRQETPSGAEVLVLRLRRRDSDLRDD